MFCQPSRWFPSFPDPYWDLGRIKWRCSNTEETIPWNDQWSLPRNVRPSRDSCEEPPLCEEEGSLGYVSGRRQPSCDSARLSSMAVTASTPRTHPGPPFLRILPHSPPNLPRLWSSHFGLSLGILNYALKLQTQIKASPEGSNLYEWEVTTNWTSKNVPSPTEHFTYVVFYPLITTREASQLMNEEMKCKEINCPCWCGDERKLFPRCHP